MSERIETRLTSPGEWIELEPWGVSSGTDKARPVMLFREIHGEATLPVWLSPMDAGITITQHHVKMTATSPHDLTLKVISSLGVKLTRCDFVEIKGHHQFVDLHFEGSKKLKTMRVRADNVISFCLQARAQFFCTRGYLHESRQLNAQLESLELGMRTKPEPFHNRHPYLN